MREKKLQRKRAREEGRQGRGEREEVGGGRDTEGEREIFNIAVNRLF